LSRIAGGIAGSGVVNVWFLSHTGLPLTILGRQAKKLFDRPSSTQSLYLFCKAYTAKKLQWIHTREPNK
jgi:hypothetical protein